MESGNFKVVSNYDVQSDILYIHKTIKYNYKESVELGNNLILDFSEDNDPVALEIIDASLFFNVKKYSLEHIQSFSLNVLVNKNIICIKGKFILPVHNKGMSKSVNEQTVNDINMPYIKSNFGTAEA
jgi:uncharacterized protein YuzE